MKEDKNSNKETLYSILIENDEDKLNDFLMRNGKKKSYCPICFRDNIVVDEITSNLFRCN